jgi:hypothetical protein
MGKTNFDEITLDKVKLANAELASPNAEETITWFFSGVLTTGTKKDAALLGKAGTITDVRAYLDTSGSGSSTIVDVNKNGTTIFTTQANRPTIAAGANASSTAGPDVTSVAAGDRLSVDLDQLGTGAADLYVSVTIKRAHAS